MNATATMLIHDTTLQFCRPEDCCLSIEPVILAMWIMMCVTAVITIIEAVNVDVVVDYDGYHSGNDDAVMLSMYLAIPQMLLRFTLPIRCLTLFVTCPTKPATRSVLAIVFHIIFAYLILSTCSSKIFLPSSLNRHRSFNTTN
jgi:hypothetical protein